MRQADSDLQRFNGQVARAGEAASLLSNRFRSASLVMIAGIGGAAKVFADVETAQITLQRVTGLTGSAFHGLLGDVRNLAPALGRTEEETLNLAIAGARLGIEGSSLVEFMQTASYASTALGTDLGQTATQLAKLRANFVLSVGDLNRLTGSIVALDEASAAAFPEILAAMTRVGPLARIAGISGQTLAALAATVVETGISAERTGTALAQIFQAIGRRAEQLGPLLGTTGQGLRDAFRQDQIGTIQRIAQAFVHLQRTGADTSEFLKALGLDGRNATAILTILGSETARTAELMALSNDEFGRGSLLAQAFGKQAASLRHHFNVLKTEFLAVARAIGERFGPVLIVVMDALGGLFRVIRDSPFLQFTIAMGLLTAAIGAVVVFLKFFIASQLIAFRTARVGMPFIIGEYRALGAAINAATVSQARFNAVTLVAGPRRLGSALMDAGAGLLAFGRNPTPGMSAALGSVRTAWALREGAAAANAAGMGAMLFGGAGTARLASVFATLSNGARAFGSIAARAFWPLTVVIGVFTALKDNMFGARDALVEMVKPFRQLFGGEGTKSLMNIASILGSITKLIGGIFGIAIRIVAEILTPVIKAITFIVDRILWLVNTVVLGPIKWLLDKLGLGGGDGSSSSTQERRSSAGGNIFYANGPVAPGVRSVSSVPGSAQINNSQFNVIFPNMQVRNQEDVERIREIVRQEQRKMVSEAS